jgi:signal transduction histidine kinase
VIGRVEVAPLVQEIADMHARDRGMGQVGIEVDVPGDLAVRADREQLGQVVMNLVRNSAEASHETGGTIRIQGRRIEGGLVEISVSDSGRGVDPDIVDRIYDPYFTTKSYGLGVGLALCKVIVERHHGTIGLSNRPGGGALACVRLPSA